MISIVHLAILRWFYVKRESTYFLTVHNAFR